MMSFALAMSPTSLVMIHIVMWLAEDCSGILDVDFSAAFMTTKEECGLSEERRADLRTYSREKKLVMLTTQTFRPEEDCEKLISLLRTFEKEQQNTFAPPVSVLQDVAITLRTQCSRVVPLCNRIAMFYAMVLLLIQL
ncbi:unnamed protein product [Haemonchus placei]|uniref:Uncharacterized protein n=1 Tax=Haemonchus placei TaxID=6290 RepID=A0A0N4WIU4_HAEPC|nr:unnamed protein product [Haemonchus placei]